MANATLVEYYTTEQHASGCLILMYGRRRWTPDGWWRVATAAEGRALVDELNRKLVPSMAQCPVCGSSKTYSTGDGWLVCMDCGARSQ